MTFISSDGSATVVIRTTYNDDGTVSSVIRDCTDSGTTAPADPAACSGAGTANAETNVTTSYSYDSRGNRIRLVEPDPSATSGGSTATVTTQYAYDDADRLCRVVENATGSTNLQTLAVPCSTATQTAGTATTNVSTRYTYDGTGNIASMIDAAGHTTSYGYDAVDHPTSRTDGLGKTVVWKYDDIGNQIRQENRADPPMTASITWTYDAAGRILTRTADSATTTYTYDLAGNKLTASDGTFTINATYDRINRASTVDDEDAGTTPDTTYTYSLATPSWTDPTGSYGVTLDKFDRPTAVNDPVMASDFTWTYGADGQPSVFGQPNGNATDLTYDKLGRLTGSDDDTAGGTDRAVYGYTYNRAGQVLTDAATVTGDASNGTITYAYDPLGRLASSTLSSITTTYGWDAVPNRTSVKVGAGATATTSFNSADRPTSGTNPTVSYSSDDDGRLTARPNQTLFWDHLGRLTTVKNAAGTVTLATYTYDPLDRLRMIDYGGGVRVRFRYVGLTTAVAQWIDDAAGTVTRSVGTGWRGERLLDWTGSGSNIRIYGENGHHDVTWLASNTGPVSQSLRYDPWGNPRTTVPTGYTSFRFQGSYYDATTDLSWVVTRWYAPTLGTFISEDSLLGEPVDPPSRHLYAYGQGDPVGRWDPDGRFWYKWRAGDTWSSVALKWLGRSNRYRALFNTNRNRIGPNATNFPAGRCVWVPRELWFETLTGNSCNNPSPKQITGDIKNDHRTRRAVKTFLFGDWRDWYTIGIAGVVNLTWYSTGRSTNPLSDYPRYRKNERDANSWAIVYGCRDCPMTTKSRFADANLTFVKGSWLPPPGAAAMTIGNTVFLDESVSFHDAACCKLPLISHEYIHVLQWQGKGLALTGTYVNYLIELGKGPRNPIEAPGYFWEAWVSHYAKYGDKPPWFWFGPLP
jgi:RHS repeat-associated protein